MATSEQAIRISAKGEFGQLQRGLKDLQGDLKNVMGEIDKGARKGGIFDDSNLHALDVFKKRFKETMDGLNSEFEKQGKSIDELSDRMKKANVVEKLDIQEQIKAREKELDVIRKQILEVEKLYKKRTSEAGGYDVRPSSGSSPTPSGGSSNVGMGGVGLSAITSSVSKILGVVGTLGKFAMGLAGVGSMLSMAQEAYQTAYQRNVGSLDTAQRIRGYSYGGDALSMYKQAAEVGRADKMGYTEQESWSLQDAYTSRGGALSPIQQHGIQKFARGYGLDATQAGSALGTVKQLGGTVAPKQFADMIAASVSQSGMLPRILEIMQAHTGLLQSINTTFKDGSSSQILAYQTTLDKLGNDNGMTKLTGQQGANVISGLNGIFTPNNDKWEWEGISALQQYDPKKYGNMGLYDLQQSFEDGLENPDNLPAMAKLLRKQAGGNENNFKRYMQEWLQDGGFNATKRQVSELDKVTNGFTAFDKDKVANILKGDSGAKYDSERKGEKGQDILDVNAQFTKELGDFGEKYLLDPVTELKRGAVDILDAINTDKGFKGVIDAIEKFLKDSNLDKVADILLAGMVIKGASSLLGGAGKFFRGGKGGGGVGGGKGGKALEEGAEKAAKGGILGKYIGKEGKLTKPVKNFGTSMLDKFGATKLGEKVLPKIGAVEDFFKGRKLPPKAAEELKRSKGLTLTNRALDKFGATKLGDWAMPKIGAVQDFLKTSTITKGIGNGLKGIGTLALGGTKFGLGKVGKGLLTGGSKLLNKIPVIGTGIDFAINKMNGDSNGRALARAIGSGLGAVGGGLLGGVLGGGVGAVPGAIGGGMAGDAAGSKIYDFFAGKKGEEDKKMDASAQALQEFAKKGTLDVDGLSTYGLQKLEEMKNAGLINFTDLKTSSTTTLTNMSESGKQNLLKLQQDGLIAIGGLQKDGTTKVTALSDEGKKALVDLQKNGTIAITDFQKTGKLEITSLSTEGAKQLLTLQSNGSLCLTSMDKTTTTKLEAVRKDTGDKMTDIYKEHKGLKDKIGDIFNPLTKSIGDWFTNFWDKLKAFLFGKGDNYDDTSDTSNDGGGYNGSGAYTGKYANFINAAAKDYNLDPFLIAGIIQTESSFNENVPDSSAGAQGLAQFLPSTARDVGLQNPYDPQQAIDALGKYLRQRIDWAGGNVNEGIKGYGEGTNEYLNKVLKNTATMRKEHGGGGTGDSSIGGSIFKNWQNHINAPFGEDRGDHRHGGMDLAAQQGTAINALKGGTISFINVDDGGKYDSDGRKNTRAGGSEVGVKMADGTTYFFSHMSKINPDILNKYESGQPVTVDAGQWIGNSGGTPGVAGSGYSTTGNHLHFGYMDANGNVMNPAKLLNSLGIGDSTVGQFTDTSLASMDGVGDSNVGTKLLDKYTDTSEDTEQADFLVSLTKLVGGLTSMITSASDFLANFTKSMLTPTEPLSDNKDKSVITEAKKPEIKEASPIELISKLFKPQEKSTEVSSIETTDKLANIQEQSKEASPIELINKLFRPQEQTKTKEDTPIEFLQRLFKVPETTPKTDEKVKTTIDTSDRKDAPIDLLGRLFSKPEQSTDDTSKKGESPIELISKLFTPIENTSEDRLTPMLLLNSVYGKKQEKDFREVNHIPTDASGSEFNTNDLQSLVNFGSPAQATQVKDNTGTDSSKISKELKVSVDVNIKGEGAAQLNNMTIAQLKMLVEQTMATIQRQQQAMNPTVMKI